MEEREEQYCSVITDSDKLSAMQNEDIGESPAPLTMPDFVAETMIWAKHEFGEIEPEYYAHLANARGLTIPEGETYEEIRARFIATMDGTTANITAYLMDLGVPMPATLSVTDDELCVCDYATMVALTKGVDQIPTISEEVSRQR